MYEYETGNQWGWKHNYLKLSKVSWLITERWNRKLFWYVLHQFTPWNLEEDIFLAESSSPSLLVLLEFRTPAILTYSLQEVLHTGDLRAPKRRTQRSPHTNHPTFFSQGVEKTNRNRNVFFFCTIWVPSQFPCGKPWFLLLPHLISLAEEWIHDLFLFPQEMSGSIMEVLEEQVEETSPWKSPGIYFMHVKLPTMRYFQCLEVQLGWVPSSDVWWSGWLGDFQHLFFASKRRDDFKGRLKLSGR